MSGVGGRTRTPRGCSDHSSGARAPGSRARRCEGRGRSDARNLRRVPEKARALFWHASLAAGGRSRGGCAPKLAPIARDLRDGVTGIIIISHALGETPERGASGGPACVWLPPGRAGDEGLYRGERKGHFVESARCERRSGIRARSKNAEGAHDTRGWFARKRRPRALVSVDRRRVMAPRPPRHEYHIPRHQPRRWRLNYSGCENHSVSAADTSSSQMRHLRALLMIEAPQSRLPRDHTLGRS